VCIYAPQHELRDEVFRPPYALDTANMPAFTSLKNSTDGESVVRVHYGEEVDITWGAAEGAVGTIPVTNVSLVAPGAATHGWNNNQRLVFLEITERSAGRLTVKMPEVKAVAPPQMYMVFLLNGKTYSRSRWVHLL
jgi:hypothetical protein